MSTDLTQAYKGKSVVFGLDCGFDKRVVCDSVLFMEFGIAHLRGVMTKEKVYSEIKCSKQLSYHYDCSTDEFSIYTEEMYYKGDENVGYYSRVIDGYFVNREKIKTIISCSSQEDKDVVAKYKDRRGYELDWLLISRDQAIEIADKNAENENEKIRKTNSKKLVEMQKCYVRYEAGSAYRKLFVLKRLITKKKKFIDDYSEKHRDELNKEILKNIPKDVEFAS